MAAPYQTGVELQAGVLLAAAPKMDGSPWSRGVALITEHTAHSTVALIVNKQSELSLDSVLGEYYTPELAQHDLHWGGPVNPRAMVILHEDTWFSSNTAWISDGVAQSSDFFMFEKISHGNTPQQMLLCQGLSVWAPGQLEDEIAQGLWLTATPDPAIIFKHTSSDLWKKTLDIAAAERIKEMF